MQPTSVSPEFTVVKKSMGKIYENAPRLEPTDIKPSKLTHIIYGFADIKSNGTVVLSDPYADEQVCLSRELILSPLKFVCRNASPEIRTNQA
jgi:hypothetical protein